VQGFDYGYVDKGGYFSDAVAIIVDGHCVVNGKSY
jgi:hypothetical protein